MAGTMRERFDAIDRVLTRWMASHGIAALRTSLGVVFFWFGFLKFFPGVSPAEQLAADTISVMTLGVVEPGVALAVLATWECAIGLGLMTGRALRLTLLLLFLQMPGTVTPMFFFPELTFRSVPFVLTIEGQYIVNAGLVIGATVRGGGLRAEA